MGKLTTHILDTVRGAPAANVDIRLYRVDDKRELVASATTNNDGRTVYPLLEDELMTTASYEIEFDIGAYFRGHNVDLDEPPFLETVVIRVSLRSDKNYHVPLLASPWSYSTYRGS